MQNLYLGSKIKIPKNMSKFILQIIYSCSVQKNTRKKTQMVEKWDHFKNRPSCKGYSPCKIFTWGQKLKLKKTCQNPLYKSFTLLLWKKPLKKENKYSRNDTILKHGPACKGYSPWKILTLGEKLKFQKTCQDSFYKSFTVVLCKKPLEKRPNIREIRPFSKSAIIQRL